MGQQEFTRFTGIMDCRPSKEKNPFSWCELGLFPLYVSPVPAVGKAPFRTSLFEIRTTCPHQTGQISCRLMAVRLSIPLFGMLAVLARSYPASKLSTVIHFRSRCVWCSFSLPQCAPLDTCMLGSCDGKLILKI
jgi:hypothetical protein